MIKAVFFARFHETKGTQVLHQVPPGSIVPVKPSENSRSSTYPLNTSQAQGYTQNARKSHLFDFNALGEYIIPHPVFCDQPITLVVPNSSSNRTNKNYPSNIQSTCSSYSTTNSSLYDEPCNPFKHKGHSHQTQANLRIVGHPVCIENAQTYRRARYLFNLAFVIDGNAHVTGFVSLVQKLALLLRNLEIMKGFLSRDEADHLDSLEKDHHCDNTCYHGTSNHFPRITSSKVYALCEMLMGDLNNYQECMVPIDDANTVNLKLFPTLPSPPSVPLHSVPILASTFFTPDHLSTNPANRTTCSFNSLTRQPLYTTDITLRRIIPSINGINNVSQIAAISSASKSLTRKAIQHLIYYGAVRRLLDVFHFSAVYTVTPRFINFIQSPRSVYECLRYVSLDQCIHDKYSDSSAISTMSSSLDLSTLIHLYSSLRHITPLHAWALHFKDIICSARLDIRRFIVFGVNREFLYRVNTYVWNPRIISSPFDAISLSFRKPFNEISEREKPSIDSISSSVSSRTFQIPLKYFDALHSLDEICTEFQIAREELLRFIDRTPNGDQSGQDNSLDAHSFSHHDDNSVTRFIHY